MIKKRTFLQKNLQFRVSNPKVIIQPTDKRGRFQENMPLKNLKTLSSQLLFAGQSNYMHNLSAPIGYSCHAYFYPRSKSKMYVIPLSKGGAWGIRDSYKRATNAFALAYTPLFQRGMTYVIRSAPAAARVANFAREEPKNPNKNIRGACYKQSQIEALPRKLLFANLLMKGGDKNHAYRVLLDSISACKLKMFEKKGGFSALTSMISKDLVQSKIVSTHQADYWSLTVAMKKKEKEKEENCCLQSRKICHQAIHNVEPVVETRKVRVRGNAYQVPSIWHVRRRERIAVRWMAMSAYTKRESGKRILATCLGQELFDSLNMQGVSIQKRDRMYKLAANSRVNARYRWW